MGEIRASIAMAVYNGEKYISEQITSILKLMNEDDELVISYDRSKDRTWKIIKEFEEEDGRIHVFENSECGVERNFENAVRHCHGKYIFYADQDDVWINDKINVCINELEKSCKALIVHDGYIVDKFLNFNNETLFKNKKMSCNPTRIWIKNNGYTLGCCMAFKSEYKSIILPYPKEDYDIWTINILSRIGGVQMIYDKFILHRIHGENYTKPYRRNMAIVISTRILLLVRLYVRSMRRVIE